MLDLYADVPLHNRRELSRVFSSVQPTRLTQAFSRRRPTVDIDCGHNTAEFFATLGRAAASGRGGSRRRRGNQFEQLWRDRLHGARDLSNASITSGASAFPVIGVMPRSFEYPAGVQIWRAGHMSCRHTERFGRLRDGIAIGQAQAYLDTPCAGQDAAQRPAAVESLHDALLAAAARCCGY